MEHKVVLAIEGFSEPPTRKKMSMIANAMLQAAICLGVTNMDISLAYVYSAEWQLVDSQSQPEEGRSLQVYFTLHVSGTVMDTWWERIFYGATASCNLPGLTIGTVTHVV